ncbi:MAG TPA: hypothetical protein QF564_08585 [Pirellulaceae bacterium]|nr:hypothetical protein [Pirellulaceae bacterium]
MSGVDGLSAVSAFNLLVSRPQAAGPQTPRKASGSSDSIIDIGDLPDGIIDVGDLPGGIIDIGDLPGGVSKPSFDQSA